MGRGDEGYRPIARVRVQKHPSWEKCEGWTVNILQHLWVEVGPFKIIIERDVCKNQMKKLDQIPLTAHIKGEYR